MILAALCFCAGASADLGLKLSLEQPTFLLYEPIPARVTVSNYSGSPATVGMGPQATHELEFWITTPDGSTVSRQASTRPAPPLTIAHGREADIVVDLVRMYRIRRPGMYRVSASVRTAADSSRYRSAKTLVEVVDGRSVWSRTLGIPPSGEGDTARTRLYEVLLNRIGAYDYLYLRIQDPERGLVYGVHRLGTHVPLRKPQIEFDGVGSIHVLHQRAPRSYVHNVFDPSGTRTTHEYYSDIESLPQLSEDSDGGVTVVGGELVIVPEERPIVPQPAPASDDES